MRLLGGRPLISYTVSAVRAAAVSDRLIISSDDPEILTWAELHQVDCLPRPAELAGDEIPLSAVAVHVAEALGWSGTIGLFQPTAPFCSARTIANAVKVFRASDAASLSSAVREQHLFWLDDSDDLRHASPLFAERVNRQAAKHRVLRETGAIQLVRADALAACRQLVTEDHMLFEVAEDESLDIDTVNDLVLASLRLERGLVIFRIVANRVVGSGHLHHCLQLADELLEHRVHFLLRECDEFATKALDRRRLTWTQETDLAADLAEIIDSTRTVIVNDVLDTTETEVLIERQTGARVLNIEDLGPGAKLANRVVNALYPLDKNAAVHVDSGPAFATLRSEFFDLPPKTTRARAERILITFGGTDPGQLAARCSRVLAGAVDAEIRVIVGPGAEEAVFPHGVEVVREVCTMAAEMLRADLILTAAGRTVYEAAAVGTPVVVLAQSAREATHAHVDYASGVVFLGIGALVDDAHVLEVTRRLLSDHQLRVELSERLRRSIDGLGARRIAEHIRILLQGL
jgi:CMP-N-acetylneuraminic acid synthetase/spore coat polysaccharide biosynthesis predicted glycosyltransferase SpsG